jgi:molecular chaperone DnaK (HSP70)
VIDSADVWLTVPAAWDAKGCDIMRAAAIAAGLVQSSRAGDINWRDRLRIITEPEAAAVHCAHLPHVHQLKPSQNFVVVDAGGGTVDLVSAPIPTISSVDQSSRPCTRLASSSICPLRAF